mmetsp:Transcript_27984/g.66294  ORF Transcript_27984/g.66294 Transcript_27984/m.66294 type:complete len:116 (-) Transcript_27984:367-714(-)
MQGALLSLPPVSLRILLRAATSLLAAPRQTPPMRSRPTTSAAQTRWGESQGKFLRIGQMVRPQQELGLRRPQELLVRCGRNLSVAPSPFSSIAGQDTSRMAEPQGQPEEVRLEIH